MKIEKANGMSTIFPLFIIIFRFQIAHQNTKKVISIDLHLLHFLKQFYRISQKTMKIRQKWSIFTAIFLPFIIVSQMVQIGDGCTPPGFIPSQDPAFAGSRCSDLILYPINAVDQSDQYRFDYSDVGFGNTHSQGATVTITCTTGGQPATVEGFDQQRSSITASPALIASCINVGGSQYTWTIHTRILQFVDCRI